MSQTHMKITGMTCGACKKIIERRISELADVQSVDVNLESGIALIEASRPIYVQEVTDVLTGTDYQVISNL